MRYPAWLLLLSGCFDAAGGAGTRPAEDSGGAVEATVDDTGAQDAAFDDAAAEVEVDAGPEPTWSPKGWRYRRRLEVDATALVADLTGFVVPVVVVEPALVGKVGPGGRDLRFTSLAGALLPYEIVRFDEATGALVAWVRLPELGPTRSNAFYLYYGNEKASSSANPLKAWADETLVLHFDEATVDGATTGTLVDATEKGHDGAQHGSAVTPGVVVGAQRFDGKDWVELGKPDEIVLGDTDCTLVAWIRTSEPRQQGLFIKAKGETHEAGDKLVGTGHEGPYFGTDHGWVAFTRADLGVVDGKWHHVAWVQRKDEKGKAESWRLYLDGVERAYAERETKPDVAGHTVRVGGKASGSYFDNPWTGDVDELRFSRVARPAAWIATLERSQRGALGFVRVGPEEGS